MRVVIAAGGTGGHVFPGIAVAEQLERRGVEVSLVGARRGLDRNLIPQEGYSLVSLPIHGFLGKPVLERLRFPALLLISLLICLVVLSRRRPDVVVGCGGYVALPVLLAAHLLRIPTLISEQDSHPGLSTRLLARFVNEIHLPTPQAASFFSRRKKLRVSGNPLREIVSPVNRGEARRGFGLNETMKTVLVFGGSQGASSINRAFSECLSHLPRTLKLQFIWITGTRDYSWAASLEREACFALRVREFVRDMGRAYSASDLVVARAGGLATAEITALGLPSILIPFPFATAGHQEANARTLEQRGAARVILDRDLSGEALARELSSLISDERALRSMGERSRMMGRRDAAERVADAVLNLAGKAGRG